MMEDDDICVGMKNEERSARMHYNLAVKLLEGRDLVVRDSSGTSDPFVKFKYNNKTLFKSKIIYKNLNPAWNESFTSSSITDLSKPVKIVVKDFDRFAVNDFMGEAYLDLTTFEPEKSHNLKLILKGVTPDQYMGYLMIDVSISLPTQKIVEDVNSEAPSTPLFGNILKKTASTTSAPIKPTRKRYQANKTLAAVVHLVVIKAKHLLHTDSHANSPLPNPYAQIKIGNKIHTTKPAERTLNPEWYEQFEIYLYKDDPQEQTIEVTVFDKRKNVCMGRNWLELEKLEKEITHRKWCDLGDGAGSLYYLLTINIPSTVDNVQDLTEENVSFDESEFKNRYSLKKSLTDFKDVGHLVVKVYKAQGLASADINGKSDPFCVVELINARLQTHTVYNSLNPQWNKLFTFQVKDIHSTVEITVLDEDPNGQQDFLGKLSVPLLTIKNNEKRWYVLKNKKLAQRAKGQILLEFELNYNPIKAIYRSFQPKEQKYVSHETKFKRSLFMKNLLRLKAFAPNIDIPSYMTYCLSWESPIFSSLIFLLSILLTYYFELFMVPLGLLVFLLKSYFEKLLFVGINTVNTPQYLEPGREDEDLFDDKNENISLKERLNEIQDGLVMMQDTLGFTASCLERIKNCFNFTQPLLSWMAVAMLTIATIIFYFIPVRILVMIYIIKRFTKKLRTPNAVPNYELIDFLSRVPSDEEMKVYGEFKPETVTPSVADPSKRGFSFTRGISFK